MKQRLKSDICFKFKGEVKWEKQTALVVDYFPLLAGIEQEKGFSDFLASPFFVSDKKPGILFKAMYRKYLKPDGKPIRIIDQLQRLYGRKDFEVDGPKIKRMLRELPGLILEFRAHSYLKNEPGELERAKTLGIRNQGHPDIFQNVLTDWRAAASKMKIGLPRLFHLWAIADTAHFSLDIKKDTAGSSGTFGAAQRQLDEFSLTLSLYYKNEKINRELKYGEAAAGSEKEDLASVLIKIYRYLLRLQQAEAFDENTYQSLKNLFLDKANAIAGPDRVVIFLFIQNLLARSIRLYGESKKEEMLWWTSFLIREKLFLEFPSVTKIFVLNRLHTALSGEDLILARDVLRTLVPFLPETERSETLQHAKISLAFFGHDYRRVIKLINLEHREIWKDNLTDEIRFKSYRVRAALCLFAEDQNVIEELDLALDDFSTFLGRLNDEIDTSLKDLLDQFVLFVRKARQTIKKGCTQNGLTELLTILESPQSALGGDWLYDFYLELVRHSQPEAGPIKPSSRRGASGRT